MWEGGGVRGAPLTHRVASRPSDVSQPREPSSRPRGQPHSLETQYLDCNLNPRLRMFSASYHFYIHLGGVLLLNWLFFRDIG